MNLTVLGIDKEAVIIAVSIELAACQDPRIINHICLRSGNTQIFCRG